MDLSISGQRGTRLSIAVFAPGIIRQPFRMSSFRRRVRSVFPRPARLSGRLYRVFQGQFPLEVPL